MGGGGSGRRARWPSAAACCVEPTPLRTGLEARLAATERAPAVRIADASPLDGALRLGLDDDPGPYAPLVTVVVAPRSGVTA